MKSAVEESLPLPFFLVGYLIIPHVLPNREQDKQRSDTIDKVGLYRVSYERGSARQGRSDCNTPQESTMHSRLHLAVRSRVIWRESVLQLYSSVISRLFTELILQKTRCGYCHRLLLTDQGLDCRSKDLAKVKGILNGHSLIGENNNELERIKGGMIAKDNQAYFINILFHQYKHLGASQLGVHSHVASQTPSRDLNLIYATASVMRCEYLLAIQIFAHFSLARRFFFKLSKWHPYHHRTISQSRSLTRHLPVTQTSSRPSQRPKEVSYDSTY